MRFCFHRPLSPHTPFHRATCRSSSPLAMLRARAHPWLWPGLELALRVRLRGRFRLRLRLRASARVRVTVKGSVAANSRGYG